MQQKMDYLHQIDFNGWTRMRRIGRTIPINSFHKHIPKRSTGRRQHIGRIHQHGSTQGIHRRRILLGEALVVGNILDTTPDILIPPLVIYSCMNLFVNVKNLSLYNMSASIILGS